MRHYTASRRAFLGKSVAAIAGITILSSQHSIAALTSPNIPYKGYNPHTDQKTDLRSLSLPGNTLEVEGTIYTPDGTRVLTNAKIEVWHLSPGSEKYRHRGYFFTDEQGDFSFKTDFPAKERGKKARIYFKGSKDGRTTFTELIIDKYRAYIHKDHWEKNSGLKHKLFPKYRKSLLGTNIQFNFSI